MYGKQNKQPTKQMHKTKIQTWKLVLPLSDMAKQIPHPDSPTHTYAWMYIRISVNVLSTSLSSYQAALWECEYKTGEEQHNKRNSAHRTNEHLRKTAVAVALMVVLVYW